jgi:TetR/AcrR family transcriptional regulator
MSIIRARDAEQKLQRKQTLLDAGWELFLAGEGQLPSVAQIVARAGLAKGTFYIYFKTKEELFLELVTTAMDELFGKLNHYLDQDEVSASGCIDVFIQAVDREAPIIQLGPMVTGVLEKNTAPDVLLRFKRQLLSNLHECGDKLGRCFPGICAKRAARTLLTSYAIVLGIAQIQPPQRSNSTVWQEPDLEDIRLSLQEDARPIIEMLWVQTFRS